jgi:hypothetical protein
LGSSAVINYKSKQTPHQTHSFLLEPRSLVIVLESFYLDYYHEIKDLLEDKINLKELDNRELLSGKYEEGMELVRGTRVSLTCRTVKKLKNLKWLKIKN